MGGGRVGKYLIVKFAIGRLGLLSGWKKIMVLFKSIIMFFRKHNHIFRKK